MNISEVWRKLTLSDCVHPNFNITVDENELGRLYHFSCPDCHLGMWAPQDEMIRMGWLKIVEKARQQVEGWPRGRSTSNMGGGNIARTAALHWAEGMSVAVYVHLRRFGDDPRFWDDVHEEEAEDQRKAVMMDDWYTAKRQCVGTMWPAESVVFSLISHEVLHVGPSIEFKGLERRTLGPLGCGCCPGGKHKPWVRLIERPSE